MMPIDLVLVRHGESEGNVANNRSKRGDHSDFTDEFKKRHSSQWRLTDFGRRQAKMAGAWIKENIGEHFDRYFVSEYARAKETAVLLGLSKASWKPEFYLRERDWGTLDVLSHEERTTLYASEMARRLRDPFLWAPPGGETMVDVCLRVDRMTGTLNRKCSDKRVLIVCHGEVIWGFRVRLEKLSLTRYRKLESSKHVHDKINNCQVVHYTRRDPKTGELTDKYHWFRSICPSDLTRSYNDWQQITRPTLSNRALMREVSGIKRLIGK